MTLNEYQRESTKTALFPCPADNYGLLSQAGLIYCSIALCGEAGEMANKLKKVLRGDIILKDQRKAIIDELGDVLWYVAQTARCLDVTLTQVALENLHKLSVRQEQDKIKGEGDNR